MTAVEVLEWLRNYEHSIDDMCFGGRDVLNIICRYSSQEIVDRIEKYETEKKCKCNSCNQKHCEENTGNGMCYEKLKFRVGDWVRVKSSGNIYQVKEVHNGWVDVSVNGTYIDVMAENNEWIEHAEPPKKEKKIEKVPRDFYSRDLWNKINELVDAVNELRGV